MNRKIYLWILVFVVLCIGIGVFLFTQNLSTTNELGIPDIPSSFNQAQIEGAMLLKSVIHWYHQLRDKDDLSSYFHDFRGFEDTFSNMFEFDILITDEDYNIIVNGPVDDWIIDSVNLRYFLLEASGYADKHGKEYKKKYFGELDKFIVSPQDRNDKWLTFYLAVGVRVPEHPIAAHMNDMLKFNFLGVWHDNKFFVTAFKTRMPLYYMLNENPTDDWNNAVKDSDTVSSMNVDVSPYTSSIDDGKKLVVTVTILDRGNYFFNTTDITILRKRQEPENVYLRVSLLTSDGSLTSTDSTFYKLYKIVDKDIWKIEIPVLSDKNYLLEVGSILHVKNDEDLSGAVLSVIYKSTRT